MKKRIIAILSAFAILFSGICAEAVEFGAPLLNDEFDSGFGTWTKEGNPTIENVKGVNAVVLGEKETVRYNPKASEFGWEDSYRATFRLKTKDWLASGNPTMLFRMKSQGNSQVYLIYYTNQGFSVTRLNPSLPTKTLTKGYSGRVTADSAKWHEVSVDAIRNDDKSMTLKVYFDGEKQLEVTDNDVEEMPVTGGVMVGNWMKENELYVDSVRVEPIVIKSDTSNPDDPAPDTVNTNYEEDSTLLRLLGIMDNYTDKLFKGDFIMTRQEFVKCVVSMMGYDEPARAAKDDCGFTDVSGELAGYVAVAENLGMISGTGNGKFNPEDAITFEEATKMLVCALGYDMGQMEYPTGYNAAAADIGLLKHIGARDTSRGTMARLLVNALDIPIIEQANINGEYKYGRGETILKKRGISSEEGVVTDNGITSCTGSSNLPENSVAINYIQYKAGITSAKEYFGQKVSYYYMDADDGYELVYIRPNEENRVYTISDRNIDPRTSKNKIYYYQESKVKNIEVSPICNFIYNGKAYPDIPLSRLVPSDGRMILIDNDDDKKVDTIIVSDYVTVVTQYTSEQTKTVFNTISGGKSLVLDDDKKTVEIFRGNEKIEFSGIKSGDVIKAEISMDKEYIKAMVSSDKLSGMVDSIDDDILIIDGTEYIIASNLSASDFAVGSAYLFRLDFAGRVAYAEHSTTQTASYAYLKDVKLNDDDEVRIKVFTAKGEWQTMELADKVRFNNTTKKREVLYNEGVLTPQLVLLTRNSKGFVSRIKTGLANASGEDIDFVTITAGKYLRANRSFNSKYFLTDSIVFMIPQNLDDTGLYRVTNCEFLRDGQGYDATIYNISENCPEVCVVKGIDDFGTEPYVGSSVMLVDKAKVELNSDDEPVVKLTGFYDGKAVEYCFAENVDGSGIEKGDVIQITLNTNQEIINQKKLVDENGFDYRDEGGFFSTTRKVVGRVCKVYPAAKRFVLNLDATEAVTDESIWCECSRIQSKIYVYDRNTKEAKMATFDDIEPGCDAFVRMDREWIYDIVIYRN